MYPETQREAYEEIKRHLPEKRRAVYAEIEASPDGLTLFELRERLGWPVNSVSGRVTELHESTVIVDSGRRRVNPATGKSAVIWEAREQWEARRAAKTRIFHRNGQGELF